MWQSFRVIPYLFLLLVPSLGSAQTVGVTAYPVPTPNGGPAGITAGPDGALWFTERAGNRIGRITTPGAITEYPIPTAGARPFGITVGPDGALWFTESGQIGRITTAGVITEYRLPGVGSPARITAGPDGALWFTSDDVTDELFGTIARITTDGVVTGYLEQNGSGNFGGIAAGSDGALWFTERVAIGRITTAGVVTEYPYPELEYILPGGIVAGPDGALWFTEHYTNKIDRITTAGAIGEYPFPADNGGPAFHHDGAGWRALVYRGWQPLPDGADHHGGGDRGISVARIRRRPYLHRCRAGWGIVVHLAR